MSAAGSSDIAKILRLVDHLAIALERGFAEMRNEFKAVRLEFRTELSELKAEFKAEFKAELKGEIEGLRHDMNKRFDRVDERFDMLEVRVTRLERPKRKRGSDS